MSGPTIYHNPRCSKSRKALAFLRDEPGLRVVRYLDTPPTKEELDRICRLLGVEPTALVRAKDASFEELGLSLSDNRSRDEWLTILRQHPRLLERPIVVRGDRAVVARPPEKVLDLLVR